MARFSERMGFVKPRTLAQTDDLDAKTRMSLWNALVGVSILVEATSQYEDGRLITTALWTRSFGRARDEVPVNQSLIWQMVKERVLQGQLYECMDIIEDVIRRVPTASNPTIAGSVTHLVRALNTEFEDGLVGYRVLNDQIVPLDSEIEVAAVMDATREGTPLTARRHLDAALGLLSDRDNPDYRNSVKESITAVESLARVITGASTLAAALPRLSAEGIETHGALVKAWSGFYGYTSDAGGVRHGGETIAKVDQALAKYVLVTCSAFVTWLTEEARLAGKL